LVDLYVMYQGKAESFTQEYRDTKIKSLPGIY
jgi:hypothetical protein